MGYLSIRRFVLSTNLYVSSNGRAGRKVLNEPEDLRPILFVTGFFVYQLLVFSSVRSPWVAFATIAGPHFILQIPLVTVLHHSIHRPLFRRTGGDFLLGLVCFLTVGFSRTCFKLDHLAHHRYYLRGTGDPNAWQNHTGLFSRHRYSLHQMTWVYPRTWHVAKRRKPLARLYMVEAIIGLTILTLLCFLDAGMTLAVFVYPMIYGIFGTYYWGHHQHAGLEERDHVTASRTYLSPVYNWLAFNVGYHAAHHYQPSLHWSRLPQLHENIRQAIPETLIIHTIPWFSSVYTGASRQEGKPKANNQLRATPHTKEVGHDGA